VSSASVAAIRWWGGNYFAATGPATFTVRFYADFPNVPLTVPFYDQSVAAIPTATGLITAQSNPVFEYSANLPLPVALTGGTTYYLSIVENTSGTNWSWAGSVPGIIFYRNADNAPWIGYVNANAFAYELLDAPLSIAVPTPASLSAGVCLLSIFTARKLITRRVTYL
jgi:hypothetical protein